MDKYTTYIWRMGYGSKTFRFQTTDPRIARKLSRSNGWESILTECNKPIWIFQKDFHTPQDARKKLCTLTKVPKLKKGEDICEFYAETYANKTLKNRFEVRNNDE